MQKDDLLILINAYGINSALIDAALEAKRRGAKIIAVTSVEHASNTPPDHPARHPSKKNLFELADLVLDSKVVVGDAVVEIEGLNQRVAAMSTFANAFLLNSLVAETVKALVETKQAEMKPMKNCMIASSAGLRNYNTNRLYKLRNRVQ